MDESFITVVSGLPRSGTSLMMQMLAACGCPILTDNVRAPDESNPRGYLEFEAVKRLRTDQTWLAQAAGKAVKIIHLLLRELPVDGRFSYRVIFMKRPIDEILASQRAMLSAGGENSRGREYAHQDLSRSASTTGFVAFRAVVLRSPLSRLSSRLEAPQQSAELIEKFLQAGLETEAMASVVDRSLYRQRAGRIV